MRLGGRWQSLVCVLAIALVAGYACSRATGEATAAQTRSICAKAAGVAAWSPDGKRIAYVGRLHAICVASADGTHARPLPYTVCTGRCRRDPRPPAPARLGAAEAAALPRRLPALQAPGRKEAATARNSAGRN